MKTTATLGLWAILLSGSLLAEETVAQTPPAAQPAEPSPAQSAREQLAATMPKYNPPPPVEAKPANAPNPDVLELPKMVVRQKPRPRLTPEVVVTRQGLGEQLAKHKFSELDRVLNKFTLPLFGSSMAERALDDYEREKKQQLNSDVVQLSKALEQSDPAEAQALREAAAKP